MEVSREMFHSAILETKMDKVQMAKRFRISMSTADRWIKGKSAPCALGREIVLRLLGVIR